MSEFDNFARKNYRKTTPAQPPAEGWNRLRRELETKPVGGVSPTRFGSGFVWGSLTGAVAVFLLLKLFPGDVGELASVPCAERSVIAGTIGSEAATSRTPQSITPPVNTSADDTPTVRTANVTGKSAASISSTAAVGRVDGTSVVPANQQVSEDSGKMANEVTITSTQPKNKMETYRLPATEALSTSTIPVPRYRRLVDKFGHLPPLRIAAGLFDNPSPKWTFECTDRAAQPTHRWEVGGSLFAWQTKQRFYGDKLSTTPTDTDEKGFVTSLNGQVQTFYRERGYPDVYIDKRPLGFRTAYLEVAHQFPEGLRLGAGLMMMMDGSGGNRRPPEVFSTLGEGAEFTAVDTYSSFRLFASFSAQYTIFRRRRFRVSPGITLFNRIASSNMNTRFVSVNGEVPTGSQSSMSHSSGDWFPLPSLNLQYQLTRRVALSGDFFPGIGLGARYHIQ